ncbi:ATP-binding cassette domain-containing protein [Sphingomonas koreensis]|uniref:ATP-binding cassette domain-containing protein n=1 Tax=Sphingomonas koreensis TaxID=93064 RepID=A0A430G8I6_9SPHN|nr:ATP-binding cassette domain-containing protein [Sphingomonas koreensis]RSY90463.1 ATP-binding cassette domain-containing protein [Sphingomonas koreensis]
MPRVLEISSLTFRYGGQAVVDGFDLVQEPGDHRVLLGPSGSGKTTLINLIAGLLTPQSGRIMIDGESIGDLPAAKRDDLRRRKIGVVFQTLRLVAALDVTANLMLAQRLAGQRSDRGEIQALLAELGLTHRAHARPRELSQGEAQRAAIARGLVAHPKLLIADEPTSALDDRNAERVAQLLIETANIHGSTLLVATHDARIKAFIPDAVTLAPVREAA